MRPPIRVRDAAAEDWPFIRDAWSATFIQVGQVMRDADKDHCFGEMNRLFAALMPSAQAKLACDPLDDDNRLGFAVYTGPELHYVYVAKDFRREGIAAFILDEMAIKRYSFRTSMGDRRLKPAARGWKYTPRFTFGAA